MMVSLNLNAKESAYDNYFLSHSKGDVVIVNRENLEKKFKHSNSYENLINCF